MVEITGKDLTILDLVEIAKRKKKIKISDNARRQISSSYKKMLVLADSEEAIYGINTGFGVFSDKRISLKESKKLNRNLIFSHAVGTGDPLPEEIVRAAMVVRINALAKGLSGVKPEIVYTLVEMVNKGVIPIIPSQGSLGSSGDLCLLAQLGLVILRDEKDDDQESGKVIYENELLSGKDAMQRAGIGRIEFSHKDGLALINGATFSAAITALCVSKANKLLNIATEALGLSLEAMCGRSEAFDKEIQAARNIDGQVEIAYDIRNIISGSSFIDSLDQIQDAYSLRCAPQVHGAIKETENFVNRIISREINAATDNPLLSNRDKFISGGNFHGEPVGMAADFLSIAITELGAISERRIFRLMDKNLNNGLPSMLVDSSEGEGVNSGIMILQYTAAALALENQTLAAPDSIKSLPTSANQEDHNANAFNAAINLWKIVINTTKILSIELYSASRGIDLRKKIDPLGRLGIGTKKVYNLIRKEFPFYANDMQWGLEMERFYQLMLDNSDFKNNLFSILI
ncbi:MAG: aromatic amino acid ammonia-lyase [Pelolinea sp.]|nr:aromatic amino acid ammonia-lyase [Pelolinea sp.]